MIAETKKFRIFVPHAGDLLTDHLPSGDGLVAFGFIKHLAERGHLLDVASPRIELRGPIPPGVRFFTVPYLASRWLRAFVKLNYMLRVRRLYGRLNRQVAYDLVHQLNPVNTGISLAMIGIRKPIVLGNLIPNWTMTESGAPVLRRAKYHPVSLFQHTILDWQQRLASAILLTTPAARDRLHMTPTVERKLLTLPHGVDDSLLSTDQQRRETTERNIVFVAGLWRRKGIYTLLEAFEKVLLSVPDAVLTIAGDGTEMPSIQQYVVAKGFASNVRLLGTVARENIPAVLSAATVFCLPSYDEPYGMSVLEAMAAGCPVVATSGGGLGYILAKDGSIAVKPHDSIGLAQALITVLTASRQVRAAMGHANRAEVASTYAWSAVIPKLEAIYRKLVCC